MLNIATRLEAPQNANMNIASGYPETSQSEALATQKRVDGLLYIVQFEVAYKPMQIWDVIWEPPRKEGELIPGRFGGASTRWLDADSKLMYLSNGTCMSVKLDWERSTKLVRGDFHIHQLIAGKTQRDAERITSSEDVRRNAIFHFRSVWEFSQHHAAQATRVRRTLYEFQQLQKLEQDLAEAVMLNVDREIRMILQLGPKAALPKDYIVFSAPRTAELIRAASIGNTGLMEKLLEQRADPNHICEPDECSGELTALIVAVRAKDKRGAAWLLEGGMVDPNIICCSTDGNRFYTALDEAERLDAPALAATLKSVGGLHFASSGKTEGGSESIDEKVAWEADINMDDFRSILIEISGELQRIQDKPETERRASVKKLLLQWHPDKNLKRIALATAVFQWLQQALASRNGTRRVWGAGGVNWSTGVTKRDTRTPGPEHTGTVVGPLSIAMRIILRNHAWESFKIIIDAGESPNQRDENGRSGFFYAVRGIRDGDSDFRANTTDDFLGELIVNFGAKVNACATDGMTPLMEATRYGNLNFVQMLLDSRADPTARNHAGDTALDIANKSMPAYLSERESCTSTACAWGKFAQEVEKDRKAVAICLREYLKPERKAIAGNGSLSDANV